MNVFDFFGHSKLKPSSVKLFNTKLHEWIQFMPTHYQSVIVILTQPTLAMNILQANLTSNTNTNKHIYIMSILSFFRHCPDVLSPFTPDTIEHLRQQWVRIFDENEAPIIQRRLENKPTEAQTKKGGSQLDFHHLCKVRDALPPGSPERLLIAMYTMIPPCRADYFATEIIQGQTQQPSQPNYIRIYSPDRIESVLTDFKTSKTYQQITNTFPPELCSELTLSLEKYPRSYLFVNANGKPHTRNSFTLWSRRALTRCFGVDFTLVLFRHIYATHWITSHDMNTTTDSQIKEVSQKMGHSSEMFRAYRWVQHGRQGQLVLDAQENDHEIDDDFN